jgi:hypothetical protein
MGYSLGGLSLALPLLRLTKTFTDIEAEAQAALSVATAASTSPRLMERMVVLAGKGHNIADVIRKGNSLREQGRPGHERPERSCIDGWRQAAD